MNRVESSDWEIVKSRSHALVEGLLVLALTVLVVTVSHPLWFQGFILIAGVGVVAMVGQPEKVRLNGDRLECRRWWRTLSCPVVEIQSVCYGLPVKTDVGIGVTTPGFGVGLRIAPDTMRFRKALGKALEESGMLGVVDERSRRELGIGEE